MIQPTNHNRACQLGDIASIFAGFSPYGRSPAGRGDQVVGLVSIKNIINGLVNTSDVETVTVEDAAKLAAYRLQPEDILLSARGSSFRAGLCGDGINGLIAGSNTVVIRLTADAPIGGWLLTSMLNSPKGEALLGSIAEGATIRSLKPKTLQNLPLVLPDTAQAAKLEEYCQSYMAHRRASLAALTANQNILNGLIEPLLS